jgi:NhaA family Na+:H+ antiporter
MARSLIKKFIALEAAGGLMLLVAAVLALVIEHSPWQSLMHALLAWKAGGLSIHFWINDALMAVFFLLIGLELKRERLQGYLVSRQQFLLPAIAACGGVIVPALIFTWCNHADAHALKGWAIPTATDIAFALCVMQLLGNLVPQALKVTLVTIAIIDDLIAVMVIALFYTAEINLIALASAAAILGILGVLNHQKVTALWAYLLAGVFLWICVLTSGIHATIAGVLLAMFIPLKTGYENPPAIKLEHALHPYVAFAIMPLFALANAGVSLVGISAEMLSAPITLGIALGLFFGKQIGVMLASAVAIILGVCKLPQNTRWAQYYAMSVLCGIGFTMSLFIGGLSYDVATQQHAMRLGVLAGTALSGLVGYGLLRCLSRRN